MSTDHDTKQTSTDSLPRIDHNPNEICSTMANGVLDRPFKWTSKYVSINVTGNGSPTCTQNFNGLLEMLRLSSTLNEMNEWNGKSQLATGTRKRVHFICNVVWAESWELVKHSPVHVKNCLALLTKPQSQVAPSPTHAHTPDSLIDSAVIFTHFGLPISMFISQMLSLSECEWRWGLQ